MKTLNITFTDKEYLDMKRIKQLIKAKGNWHDLILRAVRGCKK